MISTGRNSVLKGYRCLRSPNKTIPEPFQQIVIQLYEPKIWVFALAVGEDFQALLFFLVENGETDASS